MNTSRLHLQLATLHYLAWVAVGKASNYGEYCQMRTLFDSLDDLLRTRVLTPEEYNALGDIEQD